MKILKKILTAFFILIVLFLIAASVYVRIYGKSLVEQALNDSLKRNVVLGAMSYHFPLGFQARNVRISRSLEGGEFLMAKKIVAQLSPDAVLQKRFAFDSVVFVEPSLFIENIKGSAGGSLPDSERRYGVVVPPDGSQEDENSGTGLGSGGQTEVSIKRLVVKQGRLEYVDGLTEKGFSFGLEDVELKVGHLVFPPKPGASEFEMFARLVKEGNPLSGSNVKGSGWVDVVKRDMEAEAEVVEVDGTVGLTAKAVSQNNDVEVTGEVKMQNLLRGVDKPASSGESTVNDLVLNALSSAGVEIGAKFSFKTKMDDFQIGQVSFSGNLLTK